MRNSVGKRKDSSSWIKSIWKVISWALVAIVVIFAIATVGVRLVGLQPFAVLSGSMEPTYMTGSVVYVKKVDYRTLEVGDPITFMLDEDTIVTHRIIEVVPDYSEEGTIRYRTMGDNNDSPDAGLVHYKNIIGMPVYTIPKLGYLVNFIQHPPGKYLAIAFCAFLMFIIFLPDVFTEDKREKKVKQKDSNAERQLDK